MPTAPLHSNGSYSIVACVFVAAEIYLPSSCLAMDVYSDFTIPAFGRHVTMFIEVAISSDYVYSVHDEPITEYYIVKNAQARSCVVI
jgi:hypothetical protein